MCNTAMFVEGSPLTPLTGTFDQSYDRVQDSAGMCQDTDHNASDFFLRSPSDPQNLTSPIYNLWRPNSYHFGKRDRT